MYKKTTNNSGEVPGEGPYTIFRQEYIVYPYLSIRIFYFPVTF